MRLAKQEAIAKIHGVYQYWRDARVGGAKLFNRRKRHLRSRRKKLRAKAKQGRKEKSSAITEHHDVIRSSTPANHDKSIDIVEPLVHGSEHESPSNIPYPPMAHGTTGGGEGRHSDSDDSFHTPVFGYDSEDQMSDKSPTMVHEPTGGRGGHSESDDSFHTPVIGYDSEDQMFDDAIVPKYDLSKHDTSSETEKISNSDSSVKSVSMSSSDASMKSVSMSSSDSDDRSNAQFGTKDSQIDFEGIIMYDKNKRFSGHFDFNGKLDDQ